MSISNILENGTKEWRLNGELHNENGPAIIRSDGSKYWYINGKLHNKNGPAIIDIGGSKYWYINGERHNENGQAIMEANGNKRWFINDKEYTEEKFLIYKKLKDKYSLLGVPVRNKWRVREIVYSWYDNPRFKCVQKRLEREYNQLFLPN